MISLRPYQSEAESSVLDYWGEGGGNPLVVMATGCHARGTPILLFDGSTVPVEEVEVGDLLMGPNSKPRRVLSLARGRQVMAKVSPTRGTPFVVNLDHILALKTTKRSNTRTFPSDTTGNETVCVSVREWLAGSKFWKHLNKLQRSKCIDFYKRDVPIIEPWIVGAFLGDGSLLRSLNITTCDIEVDEAVRSFAALVGVDIRKEQKPNNRAYALFLTDRNSSRSTQNRATALFREIGMWGVACGDKRVPHSYKTGSKRTRYEVLAGLMDTDGSLVNGNVFDFVSKSIGLTNDVVFIARSLGISAVDASPKIVNGTTYWRTCLSGDVDLIPTKIARKRATPRQQKKDALKTGFKVELLPEDDYFGFELDADHLYLTGDFFIHHNTGKSVNIASLNKRLLSSYEGMRVLMLVHVRELVSQNAQALLRLWPQAPVGINSAGLGRRDNHSQILFASVQSVYRRPELLGPRDIVMIDEAHLIPREGQGMYRVLLESLLSKVPDMRVVGFTATPYRLDSGRLDEGDGKLFDDVVYDYDLARGVEDGWLSPLRGIVGQTAIDVSGVTRRGGEFVDASLAAAADKADVVQGACNEMVQHGADRKAWIAFCSGIQHAFNVRNALRERGISCETVTGKTPAGERDSIIRAFRQGNIKCLTNAMVLTTGFDVPHVDMIAMLRPTLSTGLYVQSLGRGTRKADGKSDCLVLDFAGNLLRHGPVDAVTVAKKKLRDGEKPEKTDPDTVRGRICPQCQSINILSASECIYCGFQWPPAEPKHSAAPVVDAPVMTREVANRWLPCEDLTCDRHRKFGDGPDSLVVEYVCGRQRFRQWQCLEHTGMAKHKANLWWMAMGGKNPAPANVESAIARFAELSLPTAVTVIRDGKYWQIQKIRADVGGVTIEIDDKLRVGVVG